MVKSTRNITWPRWIFPRLNIVQRQGDMKSFLFLSKVSPPSSQLDEMEDNQRGENEQMQEFHFPCLQNIVYEHIYKHVSGNFLPSISASREFSACHKRKANVHKFFLRPFNTEERVSVAIVESGSQPLFFKILIKPVYLIAIPSMSNYFRRIDNGVSSFDFLWRVSYAMTSWRTSLSW